MAITEDTDVSQPAVLDMRRLWLGGVATAVVAALIVLVGVVIARGILGISVLAPATAGDLGTSATALIAASRSARSVLLRPRLAIATVSTEAMSGSCSCLIARLTIAGSSKVKNLSI